METGMKPSRFASSKGKSQELVRKEELKEKVPLMVWSTEKPAREIYIPYLECRLYGGQ